MSFERLDNLKRKCEEEGIVPDRIFDAARVLLRYSELGSPFIVKDSTPPRQLERFGIASRLVVFETRGHNSTGFLKNAFIAQGGLQEQVAIRIRKSELEIDYFAHGSELAAQKQVGLRIEEVAQSGNNKLIVSACCRGYDSKTYASYIDSEWHSDDSKQYERTVAAILVGRLTSFMDRCEMITGLPD